jgi:hypothetical protein
MESKNDLKLGTRYWAKKVFRNHGAELYYVRFCWRGRREMFCTYTAVLNEAAQVAREIYMELRVLGWKATLAKRKGPQQ